MKLGLGRQMHTEFGFGNLLRSDHLEVLEEDRRTIRIWKLRR